LIRSIQNSIELSLIMSRLNISRINKNSNNHRNNIRTRRTRKRKSRAARVKSHLKAWGKKAVYNVSAAEILDDVKKVLDGVERERDMVKLQLVDTERELERSEKRYRSLMNKAHKEKQDVVRLARERWLVRERDLKEQYEQRLSEMEIECEVQEQRRLEAEARVDELVDEMEEERIEAGLRRAELEGEIMELHKEIEDIYDDY